MANNNWEELLSFQGYIPSPHLLARMEEGVEPTAEEIRQDVLQQQQTTTDNNNQQNHNVITQHQPLMRMMTPTMTLITN
jgi:hypothetical protein